MRLNPGTSQQTAHHETDETIDKIRTSYALVENVGSDELQKLRRRRTETTQRWSIQQYIEVLG